MHRLDISGTVLSTVFGLQTSPAAHLYTRLMRHFTAICVLSDPAVARSKRLKAHFAAGHHCPGRLGDRGGPDQQFPHQPAGRGEDAAAGGGPGHAAVVHEDRQCVATERPVTAFAVSMPEMSGLQLMH